MRYLMQARSSNDGQMYRWMTHEPDFAGVGFPGPGTAEEPAVVAQSGESEGGGETPGLPDVLAVSASAAGRTITSLGAPELPSDAARLADVEALTADSISFDPEDSGLVSDNVGDGLREVAERWGTVEISGNTGTLENPRRLSSEDWQGKDPTKTRLVLRDGYFALPDFDELPVGAKMRATHSYTTEENLVTSLGCDSDVQIKGDRLSSRPKGGSEWVSSDYVSVRLLSSRGAVYSLGPSKGWVDLELIEAVAGEGFAGTWTVTHEVGPALLIQFTPSGVINNISGVSWDRISTAPGIGDYIYRLPYFEPGGTPRVIESGTGVLRRDSLSSPFTFGTINRGLIQNEAVTLPKIEKIPANTVLLNPAGSSGSPVAGKISPAVIEDGAITAAKIANNAVTTAKMANIAPGTVLGNAGSAAASPTSIKVTDAVCDFKSPDSAFSVAVAPTHRIVDTVDASETLSMSVPLTPNSVTRVVWYLTRKSGGKRETSTWFCAVVSDGAEPVTVDESYKISGGDWTDAAVVSFAVVGSTVECRLLNDTEDDAHVYSITASPSAEVFQ